MNDTFSLLQKYTGISKYSKSEVITPQWVVSDMVDLLPQEVFNPDATFFDPAVKSGRFLIEIYYRLMNSNQMKQAFPNEQDRHKHIIENQLYGFATSPTAATVVRKALYDDPLSTGNIRFTSDRMTNERVQGAFNNMKFDVVIGNPPYNKGMDLDFVARGFELSKQYTVMITPAKWQTADANQKVASEMSYGDFRKQLVPHMRKVIYYAQTPEVFSIAMTEGISAYILDKNQCFEKCEVVNVCKVQPAFNGTEVRDIRHTESLVNIGNQIFDYIKQQECFSSFRFQTRNDDKYQVWLTNMTNTGGGGSVAGIFNSNGSCMGLSVCKIVSKQNISELGTQVKCIFSSNDEKFCEYFVSWLNCRLTRFMVVITAKQTGILNDYGFRFVPAPPSGKFDHIYTDKELYKDFNLPQKYIDVIEAVVKERK